jgi:chromosome segregation ATPase
MTAPSDTPRTNAAAVSREFIAREMNIYAHKFVLADYARELERELSASEEARRKARSEAEELRKERDALVIRLADFNLERERQQTRAETAEREAAEARQKAIKDLEAECERLAARAGSQGRMAARQYYQQWQSAIRALTTASSPSSGQAHTDHPMRHFDRTCPACVASAEDSSVIEVSRNP